MKTMKQGAGIDDYIAGYPKEVQTLLRQMWTTIKKAAPKTEESIKYGVPTFRLEGKNLVHFGGFKNHIGFFPGPAGIAAFKKELAGYKTSKGTIQFPLDKKLPTMVITKIVKFRVTQNNAKKKK